MLINGRPFTVSTERFDILRRMRASAGNTPLLPEFRPVRFPHSDDVHQLLFKCFYSQGICCFLARQFVLYLAGIFHTFHTASLFIAMNNSPFLQLLFRLSPKPIDVFYFKEFLFIFMENDDEEDIFYYNIPRGQFDMTIAIVRIETTGYCNPTSNLDFVHFIWSNYERFTFAKYCLTFIPREQPNLHKLACLKQYRAESEGWKNDIHCPACVASFQTNLRRFTHCLHPDTLNCPCLVCVRQPPSLLTSASHTLFLMVLQLNRFTLTRETTYEQYYMALRSRKVPHQQLLPPDYPHITVRFQCKNFMHKTHSHCPRPDVYWDVKMKRTFLSNIDAIQSLIMIKELFWCAHCRRGLFFPTACPHREVF